MVVATVVTVMPVVLCPLLPVMVSPVSVNPMMLFSRLVVVAAFIDVGRMVRHPRMIPPSFKACRGNKA